MNHDKTKAACSYLITRRGHRRYSVIIVESMAELMTLTVYQECAAPLSFSLRF